MKTESQKSAIRNFLLTGCSLTPALARRYFSCDRLAARIQNLRDEGYKIKTEMVHEENARYAKYSIA
jgi:hypothetical protein